MQALVVNPARRRRRAPAKRRRSPARRRRTRSRRRRRNPSIGTLRVANPRGGIMELLMPALFASVGAIAGTAIPRLTKLVKEGASTNMIALGSVGTGLALGMFGPRFMSREMSGAMALGAISSGVTTMTNKFLPEKLRISGLGESVSESDINREIEALLGMGDGYGAMTLSDADEISTIGETVEAEMYGPGEFEDADFAEIYPQY